VSPSLPQSCQSAERNWNDASEEELLRAYREMAADEERENDAIAWIEAHVGEYL
jgi:hypothetical protein